MNIKSLLLGSAAALVAVSGARAADAVMAEPEAVEYVRVCDAYGAGYFYIPGTETCLKIGGYVRYDMGFGETNGLSTDGDPYGDAWDKNARFSLQVSTASDTELGTLKTYAEVRFNYFNDDWSGVPLSPNTGTSTSLNFAWIQLGGLRIGKDESAFTTFAGYAGNVINDGQIGYGPFDVTLISYTYDAGNGFSAILSVEDDSGAGEGYMPNVVAGAKYAANGFAVTGVVAYDESVSEFAGKLRLDAEVGAFSAFLMGGYASDGAAATSFYNSWGADWALWAGASYKVSDKVSLNAEVDYADGGAFGAAANVVYTVVPGFKVTTEVNYQNQDLAGKDIWGGTIRFQRSF
jgi:opacity protein-like surface antigen